MRKLIVSVFMTADGVIDQVEQWGMMEGDHQQHSLQQLLAADLLVLGRKTYEAFVRVWPDMKGDNVGFKDPINAIPKVVASRSLQEPLSWNAKLLKGDFADSVAALKKEPGRTMVMYGCGQAAAHLWRRGLVDELRLWTHPVVFGKGQRPFHSEEPVKMQLAGSMTFSSGITLMCFKPPASR
jgi:dihydrofolate reductase